LTLYPGQARIPARAAGAALGGFSLTAHVNRAGADSEGVLLSVGDSSAGYVFYVKDNHLVFDNNNLSSHQVLKSSAEVPTGESALRFQFTPGLLFGGTGELFINDQKVGETALTILPIITGFGALEVGRNSLSPVSQDYAGKGAFAFPDGQLLKVVVQISPAEKSEPAASNQNPETRK
jgi:arylsulfatase